jgi:transcriptional regulator with XRE-family HTH domain
MEYINLEQMGLRIKNRRSKLRMTQEELATKVNVSSHYIYEIEAGTKQPKLDKMLNIAIALNVSLDYLVMGENFVTSSDYPRILENNDYDYSGDRLETLLYDLPVEKRQHVTEILEVILRYLP